MKLTLANSRDRYSGPLGCLAQLVVMTLAAILSAYLLPGVHIESLLSAVATAAVIALLNNFIRPILIVITLPFTIFTMGLFLLVINAVIILLASKLVPQFHIDGFWWALLFSLLLTAINYLLELPNRLNRRPKYQPSRSAPRPDLHTDDDDEFTDYEEVTDEEEENNKKQ